jgi:hypothetical protein
VRADEDDVETDLIIIGEAGAGAAGTNFLFLGAATRPWSSRLGGQVRISKGGGTTPRSFPGTIIAGIEPKTASAHGANVICKEPGGVPNTTSEVPDYS